MAGGATADAINAALVAQAAQGPESGGTGQAPAGTAFSPVNPTATSSVQPFAKNTYFGGVNPFRQSAPTAGAPSTTLQSSALRIPGFQGVANPFYTAPATQQTNPTQPAQPTQAQNLTSQYATYQQGYADKLAAAAAQRHADALEAQRTYETARGNAALRAEYEAQMAALQAQIQQQQQSYGSDSASGWYTGASGGLADLGRGFKR